MYGALRMLGNAQMDLMLEELLHPVRLLRAQGKINIKWVICFWQKRKSLLKYYYGSRRTARIAQPEKVRLTMLAGTQSVAGGSVGRPARHAMDL